LFTAARRQRIAVIAHPSVKVGNGHSFSPRGKDLGIQPNSFVIGLSGRATIMKAFVAATRRWRCRGKAANFKGPHVRPGEALGKVTVGLGATTATGLAGEVVLRRVRFDDEGTGDPITVAAVAPAVRRTVEGEPWLRFQMQGVQIPLACNLGSSCAPTGGTAPLPGGFTLSLNGRSTTIGNLAVAWSLDSSGFLRHTITGTADGQPMTILAGSGPDATDEFLAYVGNVLGTTVRDRQGGLDAQFTSTGPPG
jgi:hypothetical protein